MTLSWSITWHQWESQLAPGSFWLCGSPFTSKLSKTRDVYEFLQVNLLMRWKTSNHAAVEVGSCVNCFSSEVFLYPILKRCLLAVFHHHPKVGYIVHLKSSTSFRRPWGVSEMACRQGISYHKVGDKGHEIAHVGGRFEAFPKVGSALIGLVIFSDLWGWRQACQVWSHPPRGLYLWQGKLCEILPDLTLFFMTRPSIFFLAGWDSGFWRKETNTKYYETI